MIQCHKHTIVHATTNAREAPIRDGAAATVVELMMVTPLRVSRCSGGRGGLEVRAAEAEHGVVLVVPVENLKRLARECVSV